MTTARYGDGSLYGTPGLTYGAASVNRALTWGVLVDWDEDGSFTGENEAAGRLQGLTLRMGREFVLSSSGDGFLHPDEGQLQLDMLDTERRYDPYNLSSPLNGYLYKNQKVKVIIQSEATGTQYDVFTGYIADIRPDYGVPQKATLYVNGAATKLKKNIKSTIYTDAQYDTQVSEALTLAGWTGGTDIDTTVSDQMAYHWFSDRQAITEIQDIVDAGFALFWVNEAGTATYRSRVNPDTSTQSVDESEIDYGYRIRVPAPRDVLRNKAKVYAKTRTPVSNAEVWRMTDTPLIASGVGDPIWASFTYNAKPVPATSVTSPAATTDYTAGDTPTGTTRTADITFSTTAFSTTAKLIPTNSGGSGAYLSLLKIRANIVVTDEHTYAEYEDATSITAYGEREITINTNWLQDLNAANEYAQILVGRFKNPRAFPRFKFKRSLIDKQFTTPLLNLMTINFSSFGVTGEFRAGFIERSWSIQEPNVIDSTYYLEPNTTTGAGATWVFPMTFPTIFP